MYRFVLALVLASPLTNAATLGYFVTKLASDQPGVAPVTDPKLINAWGMAASGASPQWIGANGSGTALVYNGNTGAKVGLEVTIPGEGSVTGVGFNGDATMFNGDAFLFDSEDGTVSGWRGALGTLAEVLVGANDDNIYKGLDVGVLGGSSYAYLANFHTAAIDVLKGTPAAPDLTGSFLDPGLPMGYAPFNIVNIGGTLYVAYAVQDADAEDEMAGPGLGIVDRFDLNGMFIDRFITGGALNAPWGIALAPDNFGDLAGALLVGNFGNGGINAYNAATGAPIGPMLDSHGSPIIIDGLWALRFGNGGSGGPTKTLFFTAGPDEESHGLFGEINPTPEPGTWLPLAAGIAALAFGRRRLRRVGTINHGGRDENSHVRICPDPDQPAPGAGSAQSRVVSR